MFYIDYTDYMNMGGENEEAAFKRNIVRASKMIDEATHNRIKDMECMPFEAKELCRDLVDYLINNVSCKTILSSKSQSAGNTSESESYVVRDVEQQKTDIDNMICDYLLSVCDDKGTPLLYRGV